MAAPNYDPFYLVAIYFIGDKGGRVDMAALGQGNTDLKQKFTALGLSKKQTMSKILDLRPDLFERCLGDKGGAQIKLTEKGTAVLQTNELPAPDPAAKKLVATAPAAAANRNNNIRTAEIQMPPLPPNISGDPKQARKYFVTTLIRVLGVTPSLQLTCSEVGSIQEIKDAWTAGTLHQHYKMVDIMRERPDLLIVKMNETGRDRVVTLTNMGQSYAPGFEIPDPDSSCPAPFAPKDPANRKYPATRMASTGYSSNSSYNSARSRSPPRSRGYGTSSSWSSSSYGPKSW